jgi:hypothetical protein
MYLRQLEGGLRGDGSKSSIGPFPPRCHARYTGGKQWFLGTITRERVEDHFDVAMDKGGQITVPSIRLRAYAPPRMGSHCVRFMSHYGGGTTWVRGVVLGVSADGSIHIRYEEDLRQGRAALSRPRSGRGGPGRRGLWRVRRSCRGTAQGCEHLVDCPGKV